MEIVREKVDLKVYSSHKNFNIKPFIVGLCVLATILFIGYQSINV